MFNNLTVAQATELLNATPINVANDTLYLSVGGINTDTRTLRMEELFLALRGENFDGHQFVEEAIAKGAIAVVTDHALPLSVPQLVVKDTLEAYQALGHWWREQFEIPIIAVTGSCGKTTTKELIAAVLGPHGNVLKTQANYNNEIGVPKTLLELRSEHQFAVIEMAMRGRGQIALLSQIARPTVAVITNVGTAHIGLLGSEEAIAQAKCELLAEMSNTGIAILNHDNPRLLQTAAQVWQGETLTYGLEGGDCQGKLLDPQTLEFEGVKLPLPLPGRHNASNYLAALTVAKVLGVDWKPLQQGLNVDLPSGRAKRFELANDITILDETYNAGFESMQAALHLLAETPGRRHIAVLGTMKELGDRSFELHRKVGETAKQLNLDAVYVLANEPETEAIAHGASGLTCETFTDPVALLECLQATIQAGDRLLFKASHSVKLDQVVEQLRQTYP